MGENHASFLAWLPDGSLGCAWFGGSQEGQPDVYVYFARLQSGSDQWSEPVRVSRDVNRSEQNPVLQSHGDGNLTLYYTAQDYSAQDTSIVLAQESSDLGATWSDPRVVFGDPGTFIRHGLVTDADGRWIFPFFTCWPLAGRQWRGHADTSAVAVSDDQGSSWRTVAVPESTGLVHMCIVTLSAGRFAAFFRSRWADRVYRSESTDGETWSAPEPLDVPNNNSSLQVSVGASGELLMTANPVAAPEGASLGDVREEPDSRRTTAAGEPVPLTRHAVWQTPRLPLSLLVSRDEGRTWQQVLDLENEDTLAAAGQHFSGRRGAEMSYPTVLADADGNAHITYSYGRRAIKYVVVPAARIASV